MAKMFPNRTDNDIKNKFYSMSRSKKRMNARLGIPDEPNDPAAGSIPFSYVPIKLEDSDEEKEEGGDTKPVALPVPDTIKSTVETPGKSVAESEAAAGLSALSKQKTPLSCTK